VTMGVVGSPLMVAPTPHPGFLGVRILQELEAPHSGRLGRADTGKNNQDAMGIEKNVPP